MNPTDPTTIDPTERMIAFVDSAEAEEYATKAQLRLAPALAKGRTPQAVANQVFDMVTELYDLFESTGDTQPITRDVPNLDTVDWDQLADHLTNNKTW
jgi:hypothetical protein